MEKLTGLCVLLAALSLAVTEDKYFTDGDSLILNVSPSNPDIKNILWKFDGSLLAEWIKDKVPVEFYRSFKGRSTLDTENGRLVVNRMSKNDVGVYSVEINSKVQSLSYTAKYQKHVPEPNTVIRPLNCSSSSKVCTVSCDGDTTDAEPVTYSWKMGAGEWKKGLGKFEITDIKHVHDMNFTCRMTNEVSEKVGKTIDNPLYEPPPPPTPPWVSVLIVLAVLSAVGGGVGALWKYKIWPFQNQGSNITAPAGNSTNPTERRALKDN